MRKDLIAFTSALAVILCSEAARAGVCASNSCGTSQTTITYDAGGPAFKVEDYSANGSVAAVRGEYSGTGSSGSGVAGVNDQNQGGNGVYGEANSGGGNGVYGTSTSGIGVFGTASTLDGTGVYGYNSATSGGGIGVYAEADNVDATALYVTSSHGAAGYFLGNVQIDGILTVSDAVVQGNLTVDGTCTGCSDLRMKQNVKPLTGALDRLLELREVTFEWIDPAKDHHERETGTQFGFIAQDLEKLHPQWVNPEGYKRKDGETFRTIDLHEIEALEVGGIRQLKTENDALKARADKDQAIIKDQGERIARLEKVAGLDRVSWFERNQTLLLGLGLIGGFAGFQRLASRRKRQDDKRS